MSELMNLFTPDKTVEMTYSEYAALVREAVKAELSTNAIRADVPSYYVNAMLTGQKVTWDEMELTIEEGETTLGEIADMIGKLLKTKKNKKSITFAGYQLMVLVKMVQDEILFEMDSDEEEEKDNEQTDGNEENGCD